MTTKRRRHDTSARYLKKLPSGAPDGMDVWSTIRARAMDSTKGRCSMSIFHRASAVHHVRYGRRNTLLNKWKPIRGYEKVGHDVYPLCDKCHSKAHSKQNWHNEPKDFVFGSRNKRSYQARLDLMYEINSRIVKLPGVGMLLWCTDRLGVLLLVPITVLVVLILS